MRNLYHQQGITLVELLIAMVIGLLVSAGLTQIYVNNKNTLRMQSGLSEVQENARFLMERLNFIIRYTGLRSTPDMTSKEQFPSIESVFPVGATPYISGTNNDGTNNSDSLIVRYQGSGNGAGAADNTVVDCLNGGIDKDAMATNTFSLTANLELQCQAVNAAANSTQILADGVENFQILFGEDTDDDNVANRYVAANYAGLDMSRVVTVRIGMLLRSADNATTVVDTNTYNILGTVFDPPDDRRFRKIFTSTIHLRNVID